MQLIKFKAQVLHVIVSHTYFVSSYSQERKSQRARVRESKNVEGDIMSYIIRRGVRDKMCTRVQEG